jgi:hypothetical protein
MLILALALCITASFNLSEAEASAKKPVSPVKKTLDGRCLTTTHADYWKTKIYVSKPTLAACVASGGRQV